MELLNNHKYKICFLWLALSKMLFSNDLLPFENKIINLLMNGHSLPDSLIDIDYLEDCNRLNIRYYNVDNKSLIGVQVSANLINSYKKNQYDLQKTVIDSVFRKVIIKNNDNEIKEIYLKNGKFVSTPFYYRNILNHHDSGYFRFYYSDSTRINSVCEEFLHQETEKMLQFFNVPTHRLAELKSKKIHYIVCKNMEQMEKITGFRTNGIAILNDDTVVSIEQAHFHEVVHLLINFIIQKTELYTHPLFQEGLAVALGGRSGRAAGVMLETGSFLLNQGFVSISDLLSFSDFQQFDPSLSYAVSSVIINYLMSHLDHMQFLDLYKKYSCNALKIYNLSVMIDDLINDSSWDEYLSSFHKAIPTDTEITKNIFSDSTITINQLVADSSFFQVKLKKTYLLFAKGEEYSFKSKIFSEQMVDQNYNKQRYLLKADENEVVLYDLYLDKIVFLLSNGFSPQTVIESFDDEFVIFLTDNKEFVSILTKNY